MPLTPPTNEEEKLDKAHAVETQAQRPAGGVDCDLSAMAGLLAAQG